MTPAWPPTAPAPAHEQDAPEGADGAFGLRRPFPPKRPMYYFEACECGCGWLRDAAAPGAGNGADDGAEE